MVNLNVAFAHWSKTLRISGTVKTAKFVIVIGSYKVLIPKEYKNVTSVESELVNNSTLKITCENVFPGWYIWVGLVIHNKGTLPARVKDVNVAIEDLDGIGDYFNVSNYFYGPYSKGDFIEVWGGVKAEDLPFDNWKEPPISFDPCQKVISWTRISFNTDDPNAMDKTVEILVSIVDDVDI
ncbi:hypothetical protein DRN86_04045 [Candidatus Geothermarchaeota archaeon]|nr:MAG: hypothetical protein DRN86_04045 [Candidatus Geothermarchaeota archaeon]